MTSVVPIKYNKIDSTGINLAKFVRIWKAKAFPVSAS